MSIFHSVVLDKQTVYVLFCLFLIYFGKSIIHTPPCSGQANSDEMLAFSTYYIRIPLSECKDLFGTISTVKLKLLGQVLYICISTIHMYPLCITRSIYTPSEQSIQYASECSPHIPFTHLLEHCFLFHVHFPIAERAATSL